MTERLDGVTIAFDLDGTLIDTAPDLIATAHAMLDQMKLPRVDASILRPLISHGSRHMMRVALEYLGEDASEPVLDEIFPLYLQHYRQNIAVHSRPFPGVVAVLGDLSARGAGLVVCTNKLEEPSRALLEHLGMAKTFAAIAGRDTFDVHKPDPGHLRAAIEMGGGTPNCAVMVGDSSVDVATANAAQIPVIGVTFGYTTVALQDLDCDAVIDSYGAFASALAGIAVAKV